MATEYNVDFIWNSINDFWKMFDDASTISQLWRGYSFTVNNLYYQLYQLDLARCIQTIPYEWISDWEAFIQDSTTAVPQQFNEYPFAYKLPYGVKDVSVLRDSPRETTVLPPFTYLDLATNRLVLPDGFVRTQEDKIFMPPEVVKSDTLLLFPQGVSVETLKLLPNIDYRINPVDLTIHFKLKPYPILWSNLSIRDLEVIYDNFGSLIQYYKPDSYKYLREVQGLWYAFWNGSTVTNIGIGTTILKDLPFAVESGIVEEISSSDNIVRIGNFDYEFSDDQLISLEVGDVVEYINVTANVVRMDGQHYRILSNQIGNIHIGDVVSKITRAGSVVRINNMTYPVDPNQTLNVVEGEYVPQFKSLTKAVGVFDYINYPGWWREYTGNIDGATSSCFFDGEAYFDTAHFDKGIFDETYTHSCLEMIFLQYFTFLVRIDQTAWFRSREDFEVVRVFLHAIKPAYTHFIFEFALNFRDDVTCFDLKPPVFTWNFAPIDIPEDHNHFDEIFIHPTFDDGSKFDFNRENGIGRWDNERDYLIIGMFGSPHIFHDDDVLGYTFDDNAVETFDWKQRGHGMEQSSEYPEILKSHMIGYTRRDYTNIVGGAIPPSVPIIYGDEFPNLHDGTHDFVPFDLGPYNDSFALEVTYKVPPTFEMNDLGIPDNLIDERTPFAITNRLTADIPREGRVFEDDALLGFIFDDEGVRTFDHKLTFDSSPHNEYFTIEQNTP